MLPEIIITPISVTAMLRGEIDHHSAAAMRAAIDDALRSQRPSLLRLDFSGVTFIDSSAIGLVMGRYRLTKEHGGRVQVCNLNERFYRMMRMAGLEKLAQLSLKELRMNG
ncbi:MAG: STAS domain-containing protein [Oscillospiraceae bacterium]|jgi:stage II sporulation protein AA (anti-sigma F factor antagonist)|nr:STAS domain-containing protein [Oscillospiraceae bacterium]